MRLKKQHNILSLVITRKISLTGNSCMLSWLQVDNDGTYKVINCPWLISRATISHPFTREVTNKAHHAAMSTDRTCKSSRTICNDENISMCCINRWDQQMNQQMRSGCFRQQQPRPTISCSRRLVANKYRIWYTRIWQAVQKYSLKTAVICRSAAVYPCCRLT